MLSDPGCPLARGCCPQRLGKPPVPGPPADLEPLWLAGPPPLAPVRPPAGLGEAASPPAPHPPAPICSPPYQPAPTLNDTCPTPSPSPVTQTMPTAPCSLRHNPCKSLTCGMATATLPVLQHITAPISSCKSVPILLASGPHKLKTRWPRNSALATFLYRQPPLFLLEPLSRDSEGNFFQRPILNSPGWFFRRRKEKSWKGVGRGC